MSRHPRAPHSSPPLAALSLLGAFVLAAPPRAQEAAPLLVHEWGTFTCLLDDDGTVIGGVNTEDEPLPDFVHRPLRERMINAGLLASHDLAPVFFQGAPACHPQVTMRLETPVLYFHVADGTPPFSIDVEVAWRGGWLAEFFPRGEAVLPGMETGTLGELDADRIGTLAWKGVQVGGERSATPPNTDAPVWLAPRRVAAADLEVGGEAERFLFYRGVGNVEPPVSVVRSADRRTLRLRERHDPRLPHAATSTGPGWLLAVDHERGCAFRELAPLPMGRDGDDETTAEARAGFDATEFSPANLDRLRKLMRTALVADGLFADEADALLDTWRVSYFRSPGLRVFYLLPQAWTDAVMPLTLSRAARIERVMVARIELVDDLQRSRLERLRSGPASDGAWFHALTMELARDDPIAFTALWGELISRPGALLEYAARPGSRLVLPEDYRAWLELGRFRQALVLEELRRRPTEALRAFATAYGVAR